MNSGVKRTHADNLYDKREEKQINLDRKSYVMKQKIY